MRIWSVHPRYLDRQGLTAAWREALLAQKVLTGTTRGYRNHPQLVRLRAGMTPVRTGTVPDHEARTEGVHPGTAITEGVHPGTAITTYLHGLADEAERRGYAYDRSKVLDPSPDTELRLAVTDGQLAFEWTHLLAKLAARSPAVRTRWDDAVLPDPHPLFTVVPGPVADWEVRPEG